MTSPVLVVLIIVAIALALALWLRMPQALLSHGGKVGLLFGLLLMPFGLGSAGVNHSLHASKAKDFCTSCHEMEVYDTSLHINDPEYLPAVHYQNRFVSQETPCYTCHTDYTMYGDVSAKFNGLKHVAVHFFGDVPAPGKIELYSPYPNDNCLQCHRGSRRFEKVPAHGREGVTIEILYANQKSCVSSGCHDKIHKIGILGTHDLWGEHQFAIPEELVKAAAELKAKEAAEDPFAEPAGGDEKKPAQDPFANDPAPAPDAGAAPAPDAGATPAPDSPDAGAAPAPDAGATPSPDAAPTTTPAPQEKPQ